MTPIPRHIEAAVRARLDTAPAVVLLGPRQVGKTTLARSIAANLGGRIGLATLIGRLRATAV